MLALRAACSGILKLSLSVSTSTKGKISSLRVSSETANKLIWPCGSAHKQNTALQVLSSQSVSPLDSAHHALDDKQVTTFLQCLVSQPILFPAIRISSSRDTLGYQEGSASKFGLHSHAQRIRSSVDASAMWCWFIVNRIRTRLHRLDSALA